ncbi:cytochrome P450 [Limnoraphis robusta]|uniref:Cytochrome P450 n=1 Tax=Limnoraphis robusta CCNP1315 TaxID=3110306 RepID=A0ABU5U7E5_9CYAN|nr:cytochrome P450 [Limnoraphis robusta]MEA5523094.1 cytochrome P450 [Limnoraphis robusta CCNP1315]MEA5548082.1 cytochrome P450 [Limnoraphis robusta CCNP1324]
MTTTPEKQTHPTPPGNFGLPLIGETLSFLRDADFADKRHKKYGSVFKTNIFGRPTIVMIGSEANRFLFTNEKKYFESNWPPSTKTLLGPAALSIQTGDIHKSRRKLLAQAFQPRALAGYVPTMEKLTRRYLQNWEQQKTFAWYPQLRKYTFDVACKLLIGEESASETSMAEWFEIWGEGLFTLPLRLPGTKFNQALNCRTKLLNKIESIIRQRQQQTEPREDALGLLLQAKDDDGKSLSVEELKDQILTLLFAGHETLTSSITAFCYLLAQHPDVLTKAKLEQQQIQLTEPITFEQLKSMQYLDQVIKEVLRFIPSVGGAFREVIETCEFNGFTLPKGWSVLYQVGRTHQDQTLYNEPENFDPDRFSPEKTQEQPYGYIPFGGGMRECLGKEFAKLEMKILATMLLREYEWELLPNQDLEMTVTPTPHPKDGLLVNFKRSL